MARSLNKVMLIGNLGADPEIRTTPSGTRIAKARIATSERFTDRSGQQQERTDWHNITFFGKLADIVEQYVSKGDRIFVEGRIEYSQTESDQGEVKYWTDIVVRDMLMLGSGGGAEMGGAPGGPKGASKGGSSGGAGRGPDPDFSEPDDDLPF